MTFPCINEDHFEMVDGTHITPRPYMAWRHVATNQAGSVDRSYDPNGGSGQAENLYEVQVSWTNTDPISANVYALVTRGGSRVACSCRNVIYLEQYAGTALGVAPADPTASTLISRFGNGGDLGDNNGGGLIGFAPFETRAGERTALVGSTVVVPTGQTYKVRVRLRVDGSFWETASYFGGDNETELSITSGATRLDLYSYPVIP
jgi:hypothetical protein